jgi:hypothetical protein
MTRFALVSAALVAAAGSASAGFIYTDFSSTAGLQLNGQAAQSGNALRLSQAAPFTSGSVFTTTAVPLGNLNSFSTSFRFRITNSGGIGDGDGAGADGLVFVIQTVGNNVGGAGGLIGYGGISPSVGVEFDTFDNGGGFNDPNGNHVGIDLNGNIASVVTATEATRFNNGQVWNAWVDYNGQTNALEVRWSPTTVRPVAAQLSSVVNLQSVLGQNTAFIGFTSGTGSGYGHHDILSWEYRDQFSPIDPQPVPEPATVVALALGVAAVGVRAWRRTRATA